jgi:hypothetical protein
LGWVDSHGWLSEFVVFVLKVEVDIFRVSILLTVRNVTDNM